MAKRIILWAVTILSFLASAYSVLGVLMVASFSATPNYSPERARFNANLWGWCTILFLAMGIVCSIILWRNHRDAARWNRRNPTNRWTRGSIACFSA